ncbi:hypothetical protein Q4E93_33520 [Flavitalea sp. BT771]|uniref:hypothetical protein n=1 Tax=Flavitalea sp. BT771 TaxID=3063329 RepID=UPI0026E3EDF2|nr:hypothetical protein [Flavitalea sp. BT771]MDO6435582.1 hypothetical protein [Flavitalea sp. BT771]MDV6224482.1 hypothetical protein [Flavitalea sp. BT771]
MITSHQYLADNPIDPKSERLIVGTIHPHNHNEFQVPFFYGSECSLWEILHGAFPAELPNPFHLDDIKTFLRRRKIAMSDMIWQCRRKNASALDKDLIPLRLNKELLDQVRQSNIQEVFFTSGFDTNAAFKLFYRNVLGRPITKKIREDREVTLEPALLGRSVRLRILYSPSRRALSGLSGNKQYIASMKNYRHLPTPVKAWRVDYYRQEFGKPA